MSPTYSLLFAFSLTMLPVPNAEKIDNRDEQPGADWDGVRPGRSWARLFSAEALSWTKKQLADLEEAPDVSRVRRYPLNVINEGAYACSADADDKVESPRGWRVPGGKPSRFSGRNCAGR